MRTPDPQHKVPIKLVCGIGACLIAVIVLVTYYNFKTKLEREAAEKAKPETRPAVAVVRPGTGPATTRSAMETIEYQGKVENVMKHGWELINKRNPNAALLAAQLFREAIRDLDPNYAQFYNGLGRASLIAGKPNDAIDAFRKGLALDPTIADMQSGTGWGFWQLHDPYNAKQAWEAAVKIDPKSPDAWSALAWIYLGLGENAKAKAGFVALIALDDKNMDYATGLSMSRSGVPVDIQQVRRFFPLPAPEAFSKPLETAPATQP
jgi:tetratricopeptide (TPR) repeat protein